MTTERPIEPILTPPAKEQPGVDTDTALLVARICMDRIHLWKLLGSVADGLQQINEDQLASWLEELGQAVAWIGEDARRFEPAVAAMRDYRHQGRLSEASGSWSEYVRRQYEWLERGDILGIQVEVADCARTMIASCRREAEAWRAGDIETAKQARNEQQGFMDQRAENLAMSVMPLLKGRPAALGSFMGNLILAVLTVESGKDFQTAVYAKLESRG